ncbi:MAG: hypothetical protein HOJ45_29715 [Gemmatimonadetes bacterium]|nr:hypothetical protein [Gemmatimonadota bacterium]MBT5592213.1 hypothetical protein [Gemmatimonadota bacterium]
MPNLEDASGWLQPIDVSGENLAASAVSRGGWVQATHFADELLLFGVNGTAEKGWGIRSLARELWKREFLTGRDKSGNPRITDQFQDVTVIVDLGGRFGIDSLSFRAHPERPEWFVRGYQLFVHPGIDAVEIPDRTVFGVWVSWFPFIEDWPLLLRDDFVEEEDFDNAQPGVIGEGIPLTQARYLAFNDFNSLPDPEGWEIDEFQVWGAGFVLSSTYRSQVIDLGGLVNLGRIDWHGQIPEGTSVSIRTRTGRTTEPNRYFERTGFGLTGQTQVSRARYESLRASQQGDVVIDTENWDEWSAPYAVSGIQLHALGPRRALEVEVSFESDTPLQRPRLDSLSIEFSQNLLADDLIGEIEPAEVVPGEVNSLRYWFRAVLGRNNMGFDGLRIDTPASILSGSIRNLKIDGESVPFLSSIDSAGVSIHFAADAVEAQADTVLVSVDFDARVFLHGTPFSGRVLDERTGEVSQDVLPGDANPEAGSDEVGVFWDLTGDLISAFEVSNRVVTPNRDGSNDDLVLNYSLLQLISDVDVEFEILDMSGQRIFRQRQLQAAGRHELMWNGIRADGRQAPPGLYVYRLVVSGAHKDQSRTGTLAIAY